MKQFLLCLALGLVSLGISAQKDISSVEEINIYGVDYTKSKGYLMIEDLDDIRYAFVRINILLRQEPRKFDFGKYFKKNVSGYYTDQVEKKNDQMVMKDFIVGERPEGLTPEDVNEVLKTIDTGDRNKTGLILIADFLDKAAARATYQVVFFDEATKEVIYSKSVEGKAAGFGLRNYWAGSVFHIMRNWSY